MPIDETFPPAFLELEEGLHHFGQATEAGSCFGHPFGETLRFPLASPFAPTLPWTGASDAGAGKQADHAWVGGWCSDVPNPDKSRVKWFQHRITPEGEPWAFTTGDPQRESGLGALRPPPFGEGCSALRSRLGFSH